MLSLQRRIWMELFFLFQVAWLRVDTQTILTIQNHVITKNHRISVTHSEHKTWYLHIREVRETDRGWYMCQINTDPMKSQVGYLQVVGRYLFILFFVKRLGILFYKCNGWCDIAANNSKPLANSTIYFAEKAFWEYFNEISIILLCMLCLNTFVKIAFTVKIIIDAYAIYRALWLHRDVQLMFSVNIYLK